MYIIKFLLLMISCGAFINTSLKANDRDYYQATIEKEIINIVTKLIERKSFSPLVSLPEDFKPVSLDDQQHIPYMPQDSLDQQTSKLAKRIIAQNPQLSIKIYFASNLSQEDQTSIIEVIKEKLALPKDFNIKTARLPDTGVTTNDRELMKAQERIRTLEMAILNTKTELARITTERNDLQRDLSILKSDYQRLMEQKNKQQEELQDLKNDMQRQLIPTIIYAAVAILLVLVWVFFMNKGQGKVGKSLETAASQMAQGIRDAAQQQKSALRADDSTSQRKSKDQKAEKHAASANLNIDPRILEHIEQLQKEVQTDLEHSNEKINKLLIIAMNRSLLRPHEQERAAIAIEFLGNQLGEDILKNLGVRQQKIAEELLEKGDFSQPKSQLMLEVAHRLKSWIFIMSHSKDNKDLSDDLHLAIAQLSEKSLINLSQELTTDELARLFLYLEPQDIDMLVHRLDQPHGPADPSEALASMLDIYNKKELDDVLKDKIAEQSTDQEMIQEDIFEQQYSQVLPQMDELVAEQVMLRLRNKHINLYHQLSRVVPVAYNISFLEENKLATILESLNAESLASFLISDDSLLKSITTQNLSAKRQEILQDEIERLKSMTQERQHDLLKEARRELLKAMKPYLESLKIDQPSDDGRSAA